MFALKKLSLNEKKSRLAYFLILDTPPPKIFLSIPCKNIYDVIKLSRTSVTNKDPRLLDLTDGIELLCCTLQIYKVKSSYVNNFKGFET